MLVWLPDARCQLVVRPDVGPAVGLASLAPALAFVFGLGPGFGLRAWPGPGFCLGLGPWRWPWLLDRHAEMFLERTESIPEHTEVFPCDRGSDSTPENTKHILVYAKCQVAKWQVEKSNRQWSKGVRERSPTRAIAQGAVADNYDCG